MHHRIGDRRFLLPGRQFAPPANPLRKQRRGVLPAFAGPLIAALIRIRIILLRRKYIGWTRKRSAIDGALWWSQSTGGMSVTTRRGPMSGRPICSAPKCASPSGSRLKPGQLSMSKRNLLPSREGSSVLLLGNVHAPILRLFENRISCRLSREGRDVKLNPLCRSERGKPIAIGPGNVYPEGPLFGGSLWSPLC